MLQQECQKQFPTTLELVPPTKIKEEVPECVPIPPLGTTSMPKSRHPGTGFGSDPTQKWSPTQATNDQILAGIQELLRLQHAITDQLQEVAAACQGHVQKPSFTKFAAKVPDKAAPAGLESSTDVEASRCATLVACVQTASSGTGVWPLNVEIRPGMDPDAVFLTTSKNLTPISILSSSRKRAVFGIRQASTMSDILPGGNGMKALDPSAPRRLWVDLLSILILMGELCITPYLLALDLETPDSLIMLSWGTAVFWSLDLALGFCTGYFRHGELVLDPRLSVRHYLRSWCLPDLMFVMADWVTVTMQAAGYGNFNLQVIKICRLVKFLRLIRLVRLINRIVGVGLSNRPRTAGKILGIVFGLLVYNHLVCCAWCFLGRAAPSDTGSRWLDLSPPRHRGYNGEHEVYGDYPPWYLYFVAFHWTLSQMTPGNIDIIPSNSIERFFNILLLIIGLLFCSMIVSVFSGQIMQVIMLKQDRNQRLKQLRHFLQQNKVSRQLTLKLQSHVQERMRDNQTLEEKEVKALASISRALRMELRAEIFQPHLLGHSLFFMWEAADPETLRLLCDTALTFHHALAAEEVVFVAGTKAHAAYTVISGAFTYILQLPGNVVPHNDDDVNRVEEVGVRSWISEAALWSCWMHVGDLRTNDLSELLRVDAEGLMQTLSANRGSTSLIKLYGCNFHQRITAAVPPYATWPTDLHVPYTEAADLFSNDVGIQLFQAASASGEFQQLGETRQQELLKQLHNETCTFQRSLEGSMERIVSVVALNLAHDDRVFAWLGSLQEPMNRSDERVIDDKVQLPGTRRSRGELPGTRLNSFLQTKFAALAPGVRVHSVSQAVDHTASDRYGIATTYLRTIYIGDIDESFVDQALPKIDLPWEFQEKFGCDVPHVYLMAEQMPEASEHGESTAPVIHVCGWLKRENLMTLQMKHSGIGPWLGTLQNHPAIDSVTSTISI